MLIVASLSELCIFLLGADWTTHSTVADTKPAPVNVTVKRDSSTVSAPTGKSPQVQSAASQEQLRRTADSIAVVNNILKQKRDSLEALNREVVQQRDTLVPKTEDEKLPPESKPLGVTGTWKGKGYEQGQPYTVYTVSASFSQAPDGSISGHFFWEDSWGGHAIEHFSGYMNEEGRLLFGGTRLENILNAHSGLSYGAGQYFATLSANGDSLVGGWNVGVPGKLVLSRKHN